ncbi:MAG: hypothetical protein D6805_09950 [Planctomycetota bacterium]|nr:MAG: hypothetical protein D6805_09950 [Planctomycetota bacterium]
MQSPFPEGVAGRRGEVFFKNFFLRKVLEIKDKKSCCFLQTAAEIWRFVYTILCGGKGIKL